MRMRMVVVHAASSRVVMAARGTCDADTALVTDSPRLGGLEPERPIASLPADGFTAGNVILREWYKFSAPITISKN